MGLLARAEEYLERTRRNNKLSSSYFKLYSKIKLKTSTKEKFNVEMAMAREKFLHGDN